jgi:hypothetical protein
MPSTNRARWMPRLSRPGIADARVHRTQVIGDPNGAQDGAGWHGVTAHAIDAPGVLGGFVGADHGEAAALVGIPEEDDLLAFKGLPIQVVQGLLRWSPRSILAVDCVSPYGTRLQHIGLARHLIPQFIPGGHAAGEHELVEAVEIAVGDVLHLVGGEFPPPGCLRSDGNGSGEAVSRTRKSMAVKAMILEVTVPVILFSPTLVSICCLSYGALSAAGPGNLSGSINRRMSDQSFSKRFHGYRLRRLQLLGEQGDPAVPPGASENAPSP